MANWGRIISRGNVEDRRGMAPAAIGGLSLTGVALVVLFSLLTGSDPTDVLGQLQQVPVESTNPEYAKQFEGEDDYEVFASTVLGSNNDMWQQVLTASGMTYTEPRLVLFRTATDSGCGTATSSVGPHYCPLDQTIYLDETFFEELTSRLGATGGDVAEAYVISHEVGHHIQNELGLLEQARDANEASIQLELQADCFAGLWANSIRDQQVFAPGEIQEAMDAAAAVGDDRIQERVTGQVNPETWTHGSSAERLRWFTKGYDSGLVSSCDATL